jgi:hypothetical protein
MRGWHSCRRPSNKIRGYVQAAGLTFARMVPAKPRRSARTSRCLTDEGFHRVPPRGVRSRIASSWAAICCNVRSGAAAAMPAASRTSRSSPCCRGARSSSFVSSVPALAGRGPRGCSRRRRAARQAADRCLAPRSTPAHSRLNGLVRRFLAVSPASRWGPFRPGYFYKLVRRLQTAVCRGGRCAGSAPGAFSLRGGAGEGDRADGCFSAVQGRVDRDLGRTAGPRAASVAG